MAARGLAPILLLIAVSCAAPEGGLVLNLRTDFRGGEEVSTARVELFDSKPSGTDVDLSRRREVPIPGQAATEIRLGEWLPIRQGDHHVRIQLLDHVGALVLSRLAIVTVRGITVTTIVMTRDCRDVMCPDPGGDPALSACLAGRCVDPRCTVETPDLCPEPVCAAATDCVSGSTCEEAVCTGGVCLGAPRDELCAMGQRCDEDLGCVHGAECTDSRLGTACDGADLDACEEGAWTCVDGAVLCGDATATIVEACSGADDDCDGLVDEGDVCGSPACDDPRLGESCDGADFDTCEEGTWECVDGAVLCGDATGDAVETCNGVDDDCDGEIDEDAPCPCPRGRYDDGHVYLFCTSLRATWTAARDACRAVGYELATIEDSGQNGFVAARISSNAWVGSNDMGVEGTWRWVADDSLVGAYAPWAPGQPDGGSASEDCATLQPDGLWYDRVCSQSHQYVCEAL